MVYDGKTSRETSADPRHTPPQEALKKKGSSYGTVARDRSISMGTES
jgi:hypothetical protein